MNVLAKLSIVGLLVLLIAGCDEPSYSTPAHEQYKPLRTVENKACVVTDGNGLYAPALKYILSNGTTNLVIAPEEYSDREEAMRQSEGWKSQCDYEEAHPHEQDAEEDAPWHKHDKWKPDCDK